MISLEKKNVYKVVRRQATGNVGIPTFGLNLEDDVVYKLHLKLIPQVISYSMQVLMYESLNRLIFMTTNELDNLMIRAEFKRYQRNKIYKPKERT